ncbi:hypothetical protein D3C77_520900 [compost metagenome]
MQWGLIFGDASVSGAFSALQREDQTIIGAAYLYRQKKLVEQFDVCYGEELTKIFEEGLLACVEKIGAAIDLENRIEASIPDTDEFSEQEGAYAQNLFIALTYLLRFSVDGQPEFFERSISMAAENIDLISYEADSSYDDAAVENRERLVASSMVDRLSRGRQGNSGLNLLAWLCGSNQI